MKISFLGAAHQVTGSCFLIEACGKKILVDCGMEQGPDIFERQELNIFAPNIDFVLLTHAHIDHSGMLPLLDKEGFKGEVFSTEATASLCTIMLKDSAFIQMQENEWKNKRLAREGVKSTLEPIYTIENAESVMKKFRTTSYGKILELCDGIKIRFSDAGHLLGSAIVEVFVKEADIERKIVFSGDLGNSEQPLLNNPSTIQSADYVVIESTYGDREHEKQLDCLDEIAQIIDKTFERGGKIVIPSFAVGRTQELLYYLRQIKENNMVKSIPDFKIYLDSPLAIDATNIFKNVDKKYLDKEANDLIAKGINPIAVAGLKYSITTLESQAINENHEPCVIISASGMCEAGRIRHHLKHNLWNSKNTILFVGYQVVGTLGFNILSGAKKVRLFQEEVAVNAEIRKLQNTSAHADKTALKNWLSAFEEKPKKVFVVHGDERVSEMFAEDIRNNLGLDAVAPFFGEEYDLTISGAKIKDAIQRKRIVNLKKIKKSRSLSYQRLLDIFDVVQKIIENGDGLSNRELEKMTKELENFAKIHK